MPAPARLLDLTRLVSRLGRGPLTGVDRVEYAYLRHLLAEATPLFGLARTALGFVLLDRAGAGAIAARANGDPLGRPDLLSRLTHRHNPARARAESDLRRFALARTHRLGLGQMLRRHLPAGTTYLNTGHANLSPRVMRAAHAAGGRIAVLVHDTIPLDHPEFTRPGIPAVFARKLACIAAHADLVIHSATATRALTETHFARLGRTPPGVTAPLGLDLRQPETPPARAPYFVTIGTIEPRKNQALLLNVWQRL
ncbi:MAG: glycosyltransferase family 1 protein, partial [Paracoccaceae bacterium]|nr:glycosyltransferase family 1 protein [Paracoccaceae bacterium]